MLLRGSNLDQRTAVVALRVGCYISIQQGQHSYFLSFQPGGITLLIVDPRCLSVVSLILEKGVYENREYKLCLNLTVLDYFHYISCFKVSSVRSCS